MELAKDVVEEVERISKMAYKQNEITKKLLLGGKAKRPCAWNCDGFVVIPYRGKFYRGRCPFEYEEDCLIPKRFEHELENQIKRLGFGKTYLNSNFQRIRPKQEIKQFTKNLETNLSEGRGLVVMGNVGSGKTSVLAYLARYALKRNIDVGYSYLPNLISQLLDRDARADTKIMTQRTSLLLLDDFGVEYANDFFCSIFDEIIEYRYAHKKSTVITTNLTEKYLSSDGRFKRVIDRLKERNDLIVCAGKSMR